MEQLSRDKKRVGLKQQDLIFGYNINFEAIPSDDNESTVCTSLDEQDEVLEVQASCILKSLRSPTVEQKDKRLYCRVRGQQVQDQIRVQKLGLGPLAFKKEFYCLRDFTLLEVSASLKGSKMATTQADRYSHVRKRELLVIL